MLRPGRRWPLFLPFEKRGCSSVVEHLLAKEDVASSSLVTRSSLRCNEVEAKAGASAIALGRRRTNSSATAGKPFTFATLRTDDSFSRHALRLYSEIGVAARTAVYRFDFRLKT